MLYGLKTCPQCDQIIITKECEKCSKRRVNINGCEIEESKGRCEEYLKGICSDCLEFCAINNWIGWRKINACSDERDKMP